MSKCSDCGTEMKPLFSTGEFCPNECDLPEEKRSKPSPKAAYEAAAKTLAEAKVDADKFFGGSGAWFYPFPLIPAPVGGILNYKYTLATS
jgi:hypothetical protein